ncbi:hypothetical protein AALA22_10725 [Anaerovoracaceae bacterium 41-7]|uniref:hypothetical protein n=1 Tax=Emergencia sp. JLR.KK010 TaxID=3114296 RepID=UPI0030D33D36
MYVITLKDSNELIMHGEKLDYMSNGYPILVNENTAFPNHMVDVHSIENMPEDIEDGKCCYTPEKGFYENPNWREPNKYGLADEQIAEIEQGYRDRLAQEVAGNEA